jgi:hypothetical protein
MRIELLAAAAFLSIVLAGCGGGGGSPATTGSTSSSTSSSSSGSSTSSSSSGSSSSSSSGSSSSGSSSSGVSGSSSSSSSSGGTAPNVVSMVVNSGPAAAGGVNNIAYVSITVCEPGSSTACATIDDIQVDTESSGLRVFASVLQSAGLNLPMMTDSSNNPVAECLAFVQGYVWGPVATADFAIGGESVSGMPVHIMSDTNTFTPSVPTDCTAETSNTNLDSIATFGANGIIGVNYLTEDCGPTCAECASFTGGCSANNDMYYSCISNTNTCTETPVATNNQVVNPVSRFATDNNGVALQLPAVAEFGSPTATGSLIFGINTASNNQLGSAFVLTLDDMGFFTSTVGGTAFNSSFIDSGSSAYFFSDSALTTCTINGQTFYCPNTPQTVTAVNQGNNVNGTPVGATSTVQISIVSVNALNGADAAFDDLALTQITSTGTDPLNDDVDFGLPFFYGRTVFTGIVGREAGVGGPVGPYFAY